MKKIKRTIMVRKVEFFSGQINEINAEICPLCHSPLPAQTHSEVEISTGDVPKLLTGKAKKIVGNDENKKFTRSKNEKQT